MKTNIILVLLENFQEYIIDNIQNLHHFGNHDITVITDEHLQKHLVDQNVNIVLTSSLNLKHFEKKDKSDVNFRNGFWKFTSMRLFCIYEYMKSRKINNCFHVENDVMTYLPLHTLNMEHKLYLTMDNHDRCIPSIMYIPSYQFMDDLISSFDFANNDMINLAQFYQKNKHICKAFPIINNQCGIYSENFDEFNMIFDAAAIGQYLGGVDPRNISCNTVGFVNETCVVDYSKYQFYWINCNGRFVPHIYIDMLIPIANLHIHCKKLCNFSGSMPKEFNLIKKRNLNLITGEKIQSLCDHFLGTSSDFSFNPNINKYSDKFIDIDSLTYRNNSLKVFCYTHLLDRDDILDKLLMFKDPYIMILHNSDCNFEEKHLDIIKRVPNIMHVYCQNANIVDDFITPIPIGLANSQWSHGDLDIFNEVMCKMIKKDKNIYFGFSIDTNPQIRQECFDIISKKQIDWKHNEVFHEYLSELKRHKYAICPEGNGIDTHRLWECIYLGVVPICKRNYLTEYFSRFYSIVLLDDWNELDLIYTERNRYLDISHYEYEFNKYRKIRSFFIDIFDNFFEKKNEKTDHETLCRINDRLIAGHVAENAIYTHICYYTMRNALCRLAKKKSFTFVETGCSAHGTKSTLLWDKFVNSFGGSVISVDLNPDAVKITNDLTSEKTKVVCSDSLDYLPTINTPIDFLYLDSYDVDYLDPMQSAQHHLKELRCVRHLLHDGTIILIDDTPISPEWLDNGVYNSIYMTLKNTFNQDMAGKGSLVYTEMKNDSIKHMHQYQLLLEVKSRFDIVICVGPHDRDIICRQIEYTKRNIIGHRNIYLIVNDINIQIDGCITIDERMFPFNGSDIQNYNIRDDRSGWYLQQLYKLYAAYIPNISERYLVIDCDTFFIKPIEFIEGDKCLYNYGEQYHQPYFDHMKKLCSLNKQNDMSGICHHMMFEKKYINELFKMSDKPFYQSFLENIDGSQLSGASEYEIYFNFVLKYHPSDIKIRQLKFLDSFNDTKLNKDEYSYVSNHWYERKEYEL